MRPSSHFIFSERKIVMIEKDTDADMSGEGITHGSVWNVFLEQARRRRGNALEESKIEPAPVCAMPGNDGGTLRTGGQRIGGGWRADYYRCHNHKPKP